MTTVFDQSYADKHSVLLSVDKEDINFNKVCIDFFTQLKIQFEDFKKKISKKEKEWKFFEEKNKGKITFYPEILSRQSPITIINAKWGTGKTYFIEKCAEKFILNDEKEIKNQTDYIKKIFIIDAWKYSASPNIPTEIILTILTKIKSFFSKNIINIKQIRGFYNYVIRPTAHIALNWLFHLDVKIPKAKESSKDEKIEKIIRKINKKLDKKSKKSVFLFFIDNLKRLGRESWKVLKSITKLSQLKNMIFIFPMHIEKMHNNKPVAGGEFPIEKYVDLKIFKFEQNLKSLFCNLGFEDKIAEALVTVFSKQEQTNGSLLTIREIERVFINKKLNQVPYKNNKYLLFKEIYAKNIWGRKELSNSLLDFWVPIFTPEINSILNLFKKASTSLNKIKRLFESINGKTDNLNSRLLYFGGKGLSIDIDELKTKINWKTIILEWNKTSIEYISILKTEIKKLLKKTESQSYDLKTEINNWLLDISRIVDEELFKIHNLVKNNFEKKLKNYFTNQNIWDLAWINNLCFSNVVQYLLDEL